MKRQSAVVLLSSLLILTSCSSDESTSESESTEASESTAATETTAETPFVGTGGEPGLTEAEIDDEDMSVVGSYDINGDKLEDGADGPPSAAVVDTFTGYTDLIPAQYREGVVAFVAIDQETSDGLDGALQDVMGADGEATGDRYLALDTTGSSTELERTIVHETGHLIFVNPGDVGTTEYSDAFNAEFPPGDDYSADAFVTEYAASTPEDGGEDIAESSAMFVLGDTEKAGDADDDGELDVVEPDTLAAEKVAFFEDYPELVELADQIRQNAGV